jgi:hypothetical protein
MRRNFLVQLLIRDGIKMLLTIDYNPKIKKIHKNHRGGNERSILSGQSHLFW